MFNPHSNSWLLNKFNYYKELRNREHAYWSEKYKLYVITRYNDVLFALNSPNIFSSSQGNLIVESSHRFGRTLGASDNPIHNLYKDIVKGAYSKSNIDRIASRVAERCELFFSNRTYADISTITNEISAWIVVEILGLPYSKEAVKNIILDIQKATPQAVQHSITRKPHDDLVSLVLMLLNNNIAPQGPGIYYEYIKAGNPQNPFIMSLFTGPTISGASSMAGALQFLTLDLYKEKQLSTIINDTTLISNAINESLRFNASTGRFSRTVVKPVTIHNINLKPGDRVALCLESANRDSTVFETPDTFNINRDTKKHLAFGHGVHSCIALAISKVCMEEYLSILLKHFGSYTVTTKLDKLDYIMTASGNDDMISNLIIEKHNAIRRTV